MAYMIFILQFKDIRIWIAFLKIKKNRKNFVIDNFLFHKMIYENILTV